MTVAAGSNRGSLAVPGGRISKLLINLFMKPAAVSGIDDVADRYRLIALEGPALRDVEWTPGTQVQIPMRGSLRVVRTYTPIEWDASTGRTSFLGYAHGGGPGSNWLDGLQRGDVCDLFGPNKSIDARPLPGALAVFGDETSIGLGYSLKCQDLNRRVSCYFEIGNVPSAERVVTSLGIEKVTFFLKQENDAHLEQMEGMLPALADAATSFVLTGKAGTIQRLRQTLKRLAVPPNRIATKAYWAPGKQGLD